MIVLVKDLSKVRAQLSFNSEFDPLFQTSGFVRQKNEYTSIRSCLRLTNASPMALEFYSSPRDPFFWLLQIILPSAKLQCLNINLHLISGLIAVEETLLPSIQALPHLRNPSEWFINLFVIKQAEMIRFAVGLTASLACSFQVSSDLVSSEKKHCHV